MANYTPNGDQTKALSHLLIASGLDAAELSRFFNQLKQEIPANRFELINSRSLASVTTGTDVLFIQGNASIDLRTLPKAVTNDLNALIIQATGTVNLQLPANLVATVILGNENDKVTYTGSYAATIFSGAGNDNITSQHGNDRLNTGNGNDTINSGNGNDTVLAGTGADKVSTGNGHDRVSGGSGNDTINTGAGNDRLGAGSGQDNIDAGSGNDTVNAGDGNDKVYGNSGNDLILADNGNDWLESGSGNDTVYAGTGNDTIMAGSGNDSIFITNTRKALLRIDGGTGSDKLVLADRKAPVVLVESFGDNGVLISLADDTLLHVTQVEKFAIDFNHNNSISHNEVVSLVGLLQTDLF
jgi:Ca2+-binding RTX toxin-like protein